MNQPDVNEYHTDNIFARMIRKELDCRLVLETEHTIKWMTLCEETQ